MYECMIILLVLLMRKCQLHFMSASLSFIFQKQFCPDLFSSNKFSEEKKNVNDCCYFLLIILVVVMTVSHIKFHMTFDSKESSTSF